METLLMKVPIKLSNNLNNKKTNSDNIKLSKGQYDKNYFFIKSSGIVCSNQNCDIECYKTVVFTERKRRDYSKNKRYCYKK